MEKGQWRKENGEGTVEKGEWRRDNGERRMEKGEWRKENGEGRRDGGLGAGHEWSLHLVMRVQSMALVCW